MELSFAITALICSALLLLFHRARMSNLQLRELYQIKFSNQLDVVYKDECTNQEDMECIHYFINTINKNGTVVELAFALAHFFNNRFKGAPMPAQRNHKEMSLLMVYWMYSVSYRSVVGGAVIRYFMHALNDPKLNEQWRKSLQKQAHSCEVNGSLAQAA